MIEREMENKPLSSYQKMKLKYKKIIAEKNEIIEMLVNGGEEAEEYKRHYRMYKEMKKDREFNIMFGRRNNEPY